MDTQIIDVKTLNVHQKINLIMGELNYLKKTETVGSGNFGYTAISHDHVTRSLQPLMVKHRLTAIPEMCGTTIKRYSVKTRKGEEVDRYETSTMVNLKITNIDDPKDFVTTSATAHGFDNQDKSCGKAYSMATKYCYLKAFMIASGDDEEQRVEESTLISIERQGLESELKELLKAQGKLNEGTIAYMGTLDLFELQGKIDEYSKGK